MGEVLDAIVIGAGWAGLGVSYFLQQHGCAHCVVERGRVGETWRTQRCERDGLDAPLADDDPAETVSPRLQSPPIRSIDWAASGTSSIIWCIGFSGDFSWVKLPGVLDDTGQPVHEEGVGNLPGLFFAGLDFAVTRKSGTIPAVAEEAPNMADRVAARLSV